MTDVEVGRRLQPGGLGRSRPRRRSAQTPGRFSARYVTGSTAGASSSSTDTPTGEDERGEDDYLYITDLRGHIVRQLNVRSQGLGLTWAPSTEIAYVYDRGDNRQDKCGD